MDIAERVANALKPPVCPKCGSTIDYLINVCEEWAVYRFWINGDGEAEYEHTDTFPGDVSEFECPKCHETLFDDEDEAEAFLKGEVDEGAEHSGQPQM